MHFDVNNLNLPIITLRHNLHTNSVEKLVQKFPDSSHFTITTERVYICEEGFAANDHGAQAPFTILMKEPYLLRLKCPPTLQHRVQLQLCTLPFCQ
jgi:hypothetical protein